MPAAITIVASLDRQEGLTKIFKTSPVKGILSITSFTDNASGSYTKTFRYTKDGVTFSDPLPLTFVNLAAITFLSKNATSIEVTYKTTVVSDTVTSLSFSGTEWDAKPLPEYFQKSLFSRYFNSVDPDVMSWYVNVLDKLYHKGLIANYLDRLDDFGSPADFLAFWGSIAKFYSFYVELARTFSTFYESPELIRDLLAQRGMITSPEDNIAQLDKLLEQYFYRMGERGTARIVSEGSDTEPAGELLRLINYKKAADEFLFLPYRKHMFGWNMGNASPLHRGLRRNDNANKAIWSPGYVSMIGSTVYGGTLNVTDSEAGGKDTLTLSGSTNTLHVPSTAGLKLDPRMDYEISFKVKMISGNLSMSLEPVNATGTTVSSTSRSDGSNTNAFFSTAVLSRTDKFLTVKAFLYNKNKDIAAGSMPNVRQGQNLIANANMVNAGLLITASGSAKIYDFRIVPIKTNYSRGFMQSSNFISAFLVNRNASFTKATLEEYVKHYLIPYNCHFRATDLVI